MKKLSLAFTIFLVTGMCFGQNSSHKIDTTISTISDSRINTVVDYQLLYENQKEYTSDIITTVYWALSSIMLIILAIIGSNIFFNFRFNQKLFKELEDKLRNDFSQVGNDLIKISADQITNYKEKSSNDILEYKQEIIKLLQSSSKQLDDKYEDKIDNLTKGLNKHLESSKMVYVENLNQLTQDYNERLSTASKNITKQMEATQKLLDERNSNLNNSIKKINNKLENLNNNLEKYKNDSVGFVKSEITNLKHDVLESIKYEDNIIKMGLYQISSEVWILRKVFAIALRYNISEANIKIELGWLNNLGYSLDGILDVLTKMNVPIGQNEIDDIIVILDKAPDETIETKQKIMDTLKKLKVRD